MLARNTLRLPLWPQNYARLLSCTRSVSLRPDFSKLRLKKSPPGNIVGTVNDAYIPPPANHYEGGHHWTYERLISAALVPLLVTPIVAGVEHPLLDVSFCLTLLFHVHAGLKSCIIDYIPKRVYGVWHTFASGLLTLGSFVGMYGVYVLETTENGLFALMKALWGA